ncbi:hypothetical protein [Iamia sp.]|nr:hypothetical protein [Iamia sp.]HXH58960.1 hypothetical protein [Iamia sp.]
MSNAAPVVAPTTVDDVGQTIVGVVVVDQMEQPTAESVFDRLTSLGG